MPLILGIDPGSRLTGFGIIRSNGRECHYVSSGCIRTQRTQKDDFSSRLLQIYQALQEIVQKYRPEEGAIEQVFMHRNANSALKLGQARGVAIIALAQNLTVLAEYSARQIKQAVIGYGGGEKTQVQYMVQTLLHLDAAPQADAADALAVAICHAHSRDMLQLLAQEQR